MSVWPTPSRTRRSLLTAAFTGLRRGELVALCWRDVDFAAQREFCTGEDKLVFPGVVGNYLDASALSRRYKSALRRADLRPLRFHDLRHTFGTRMSQG